ncbi:MAG TPA: transcriptional regulator [Terriglobales bacterium]
MQIKPIRNDKDHAAALLEVERLWGAKRGTPDGDKLDVLITLVEAFERERFPIDTPDPIEAIRFRLEQQGKDLRSLIGVIGQRTRVYEVMRRNRPLSLAMIRRLHKKLGIPAEVLICSGRPTHRKQSAAKIAKPSRQSA